MLRVTAEAGGALLLNLRHVYFIKWFNKREGEGGLRMDEILLASIMECEMTPIANEENSGM